MEELRRENAWLVRLLQGKVGFLDLREITFSANIAAALVYAYLAYLSRNQSLGMPVNDAVYLFLRSAYRVNDFLHVRSTDVISTRLVARQMPAGRDQLGYELLIFLTTFALGALVLLLLRLAGGSAMYRILLSRIAGITALFAAPFCFLFVSWLTWTRVPEPPFRPRSGFWESPTLAIFGAEILCLIALLGIRRRRSIPLYSLVILALVHYWFWIVVFWPPIGSSTYQLYAPYMLISLSPLAGIVCFLCMRTKRNEAIETTGKGRTGIGTIITALMAVAILCLLWLPKTGAGLAKPKNLDSLTIQMSRGPCRGGCPIYTITIQGNGALEYLGEGHVRVLGTQTNTVSREQIIQALDVLDGAKFLALEDRAFAWCFDTNSVAVSVSVDGRTKRVVSDGLCSGARFGMQAKFVKSASEIDAIVGSSQLVR
jgi:hypothetical protein